jgi:hypothetical protein
LRDGELIADEAPESLLRRTRTDDLDEAFLRLVRRGGRKGTRTRRRRAR